MTSVSVALPAAAAAYSVVVERGALGRLPELLRGAVDAHRWAVIADSNVAHLHGDATMAALRAAGADATLLTFPAGESSKTRGTWAALTDAMLAAGLGRDAAVLALGGGVTTDLAGFVAATYLRGVPAVLAPTSLLAMVDAAIGGKTGVDVPAGKNLVGAFHHPRLVIADPAVLGTLPDGVFAEGLAEAVKHAAVEDGTHFEWIAAEARSIREREPRVIDALIHRSVEIKAALVSADPLERGRRAVLNFGHTIAHALERLSGYGVPHGHAVSIGCVAEAALGEATGVTAAGTAARLSAVLGALGLPVSLPAEFEADAVLGAAAGDKKSRAGMLRFALLERIGTAARDEQGNWTHALEHALAAAVLRRGPATARHA